MNARLSHLFVSDIDGALFDTREPEWHKRPPLRSRFAASLATIETPADLKATLRAGSRTDWGGYPLFFRMADGEPASFDGVRANLRECLAAFVSGDRFDSWRVVGCEPYMEGADMECSITGEPIASAYGDPDEPEPEPAEDRDPISARTTFIVYGGQGRLTCQAGTGLVLAYRPEEEGDYGDIFRVDLAEFRRAYPGEDHAPHDIDILDIGFWASGPREGYEPAEPDYRATAREGLCERAATDAGWHEGGMPGAFWHRDGEAFSAGREEREAGKVWEALCLAYAIPVPTLALSLGILESGE